MYLPLGKTGTNTMMKVFGLRPVLPKQISSQELQSAVKIAVVRDPYLRAVSSYLEVMKLRPDGDYLVTQDSAFYAARADPARSFRLFLEFLQGDNFYDDHLFPQSSLLRLHGFTLEQLDHVILFERYEEGLRKLQSRYGLPRSPPIPVVNAGPSAPKTRLQGLATTDTRIRALIETIYAGDFRLYQSAKRVAINGGSTHGAE